MFQPQKRNPARSMNRGDSLAASVQAAPSFSPGLKPRKEHEGYFDDHAEFGDFTPDERSKIGEHISKKIKEGWPREQAIAASINIVAPEKSKSAKHSAKFDDYVHPIDARKAPPGVHPAHHAAFLKHGYKYDGKRGGGIHGEIHDYVHSNGRDSASHARGVSYVHSAEATRTGVNPGHQSGAALDKALAAKHSNESKEGGKFALTQRGMSYQHHKALTEHGYVHKGSVYFKPMWTHTADRGTSLHIYEHPKTGARAEHRMGVTRLFKKGAEDAHGHHQDHSSLRKALSSEEKS